MISTIRYSKNKSLFSVLLFLLILSVVGCKKNFLDVVPNNVPTLENAFENRQETRKYLATCYSYLPNPDPLSLFFFGTDDVWAYTWNLASYNNPWRIARGEQNKVSPLVDFWDAGSNGGIAYFNAIRDCNIFLDNMYEGSELRPILNLKKDEQLRWIGEAKFLKAFYNFYLLRMYGPIPIIDKNLPISATKEDVTIYRQPFDSCVNYISNLIDESVEDLPLTVQDRASEYGRVNKVAALFLKAKLLTTAASPLFNGNQDYMGFKDNRGVELFNSDYDKSKWDRALEASEDAVDAAESAGFKLYEFSDNYSGTMSNATKTQLSIRGSVSAESELNTEAIFAITGRSTSVIQNYSLSGDLDPRFKSVYLANFFSPTLKMAEMFYTKNGVPINEDKTWNYSGRYSLRTATSAEKVFIQDGYSTASLNFDRENRFYANLGFDGGSWFLESVPSKSDEEPFYIKGKFGQKDGKTKEEFYNVTGYWIKSLANWRTSQQDEKYTTIPYSWPLFKLSDLYLLYAECLNEVGSGDEAIFYLDKIRERAGLSGVKESWNNFSNKPDKYNSIDGLREIIHRERDIELCFQGQRIWDIRRWKEAADLMNTAVKGWDVLQKEDNLYYRPKVLFNQTFVAPRDYLWPIKEYDLSVNTNLIQNPGW